MSGWLDAVKVDCRRVIAGEPGLAHAVVALCFNLGFHAVLLYRLSHWLHHHHLSGVGLVVSHWNSVLTGAQVSRRATIGRGLMILHPSGIVIGATAVIGDYCTLVGGNTLGQLRGTNDRPCIGDHFFAGAGSKILGAITIGAHVRVGANSVVIHSLPDHVTSIGIPARIVARRGPLTPRPAVRGVPRDAIFECLVVMLHGLGIRLNGIAPDSALFEGGLNLDSIGLLQLACALDDEFGVSAEQFAALSRSIGTIGSLITWIEHHDAERPRVASLLSR